LFQPLQEERELQARAADLALAVDNLDLQLLLMSSSSAGGLNHFCQTSASSLERS
jgi:hypothetical protein